MTVLLAGQPLPNFVLLEDARGMAFLYIANRILYIKNIKLLWKPSLNYASILFYITKNILLHKSLMLTY